MKRLLLVALALCGVFAVATSASAYSVTVGGSTIDVGDADTLYASIFGDVDYNPAKLDSASKAEEADWINLNLGSSFTKDDIAKYDPPTIIATNEDPNVVAIQFTQMLNPDFFYLKVGGQNHTGYTHYLFENYADLGWGVVDLDPEGESEDIRFGISHVGSLGGAPVPEPGTIVLLAAGLLGIGVYGRKRIRK